MHVHLDAADLPVLLSFGITGVRDMGGDFDEIRAWRAANRVSMFRAYVSADAYAAILAGFQRLLPRLRAHHLPLLAGTDLDSHRIQAGASLHDELELLVGAGLPPLDALRAATSNATRYLAVDDSLGSVRRGPHADIVLLAANPLHDNRHARRIVAVVRAGQLVGSDENRALDAKQ
jgi:predicted amidohydrolase YtcJ